VGLKEEFIDLLEKDREFRYAVAGLIGLREVLERLDKHEEELIRLREDLNRLREDLIRLREDMNKGFELHWAEIQRLRKDMNKGFESINRLISALGARWGVMAEEAVREGLKKLITKEFGYKVERWRRFDGEGYVYGYPSDVEVDVAIHNDMTILLEVKSHVSAGDVYIFKRKKEFYEKMEGKKVSKAIVISPYIDDKAYEVSRELGIEVIKKY